MFSMNGMMRQSRNSHELECALLYGQLKGDVFAWSLESEGTKTIDEIFVDENRGRRRLARTKR